MKRKAGASARTARSSGPASSSTPSARTASSSALPRSPATSPNGARPSSSSSACSSSWRESQKLDALGQLTGGVAHDFNNLLMIISGSLHTLKKGVDDDTKPQRALSAIESATRRGAALTSQLLTFARRQSLNPQAIDVDRTINAVRDVLNTGVGGTVELQFDVERRCLAGHGRRLRTRNRAGQSRHQRARRHARRRHDYGRRR